MGCILAVVGQLCLGFLFSSAQDWCYEGECFDVNRVPSEFVLRDLSQLGDILGANCRRVRRKKYGLGMLRGKLLSGPRRTRLQQQRRPLRTRLTDVRPGHLKELPLVINLPD